MKDGDRFGKWTVTADGGVDAKSRNRLSVCRCNCGTSRTVSNSDLRRGKSISCGCHRREINTSHGMSSVPEYRTWIRIWRRCTDTKAKQFKDYGGRGIRVCDRWKQFDAFFSDMGERPSPQHEIDRIDNDGNYEPSNCRWATKHVQSRNKRSNRIITIGGVSRTVSDWAEINGISRATIFTRLFAGWPEVEAVVTPVGVRHRWNPVNKPKKGR